MDLMLVVLGLLTRAVELALVLPISVARFILGSIVLNPRLGPLRWLTGAAFGYALFALALVYVVAPVRGVVGAQFMAEKLRYDAERWLATAVYDRAGNFVGTFDPRLDSVRDVNYTDVPIAIGDYVANPDHKSIPVREVPPYYWQCLVYHEDRYIGGPLNPFGIDLLGVLKIPYSSLMRSLALRHPTLGVGGSTLPMQLARVIYNTPPRADEGVIAKLGRKFSEWWLAPVIYYELTKGGDDTPLKEWAANHIWLAQRTGGPALHGVEVTSRIVFGKEAKDLTIAEQFVLASAVNKPIILLPGDERLNAVRLDRWRYVAEVRARICAERLIDDEATQKQVLFDLIGLAGGPPDPKVKPRLQETLERYAAPVAKRAEANPNVRAIVLMPEALLAIREEMKQGWGYDWRNHVRSVTATIDPAENLAFRERVTATLAHIDKSWSARLSPGFTLDPAKATPDRRMPNVVVVAANQKGEIVRFYDAGLQPSYFGAANAHDERTGHYLPEREGRRIASTGKILAAIAIANEMKDGADAQYVDPESPGGSAETCAKGNLLRTRRAEVAFACSLNRPVEWRAAQGGQVAMRQLIERFGFAMPPAPSAELSTPPTTAAVRGLIAGSPQRVHHMAHVVLAALTGRGGRPVPMPTLVRSYDFTSREEAGRFARYGRDDIVPARVIRPDAQALVYRLLKAPLCLTVAGKLLGTLKDLSHWCADRRADIKLHFVKSGTDVTADPNATVDAWITGGVQFATGAAYSYVVVVGTGSGAQPFGHNLHAAQLAVPLVDMLLDDLKGPPRRAPVAATQSAKQASVAGASSIVRLPTREAQATLRE
jgi:membrane peptidoglycan carboxypeptidase